MMRIPAQDLHEIIQELLFDPIAKVDRFTNTISLDIYAKFIDSLLPILGAQPAVIRTNYHDVHIIGDLHGSVETASKIIDHFFRGRIKNLIFLGDYVDRGRNSLAVLSLVLALFKSFPNNVVVLKGNHESRSMNRKYGFFDQLESVFGTQSHAAKEAIINLYDHLSVAAITAQNSLCVHGGIPKTQLSIFDECLKKPYHQIQKKDLQSLLLQLQWNDPDENQTEQFKPSMRGRGVFTFNAEAVEVFLEKEGLNRVIRAHEAVRGPYQSIFEGKIQHIFTSEPYFGRIPHGAILHETTEGTEILTTDLSPFSLQ